MKATEKLPALEDDRLVTPEVGSWAEEKYRLVTNYSAMARTLETSTDLPEKKSGKRS